MRVVEKNVHRLVCSLLLAATCLYLFGNILGMGQITIIHLLVLAMGVGSLAVWCQMHIRGRIIMILTAIVVVMAPLLMLKEAELKSFLEVYREYCTVFLLGTFCFGINMILTKIPVLKYGLAISFLIILLGDLFTVREVVWPAVVTILTNSVIIYVEWTERGWKKERTEGEAQTVQRYTLWIMPFVIFYFLLLCAMPVSKDPYDWQFAKDVYLKLREAVREVEYNWLCGDREDFSMGASGFSGKGGLLGRLSEDEKEIMQIKGQKSLKTNVYLIGKVYDTFDGRRWEQKSRSDVDDRTLDALETLQAVRLYDGEMEDNYVHVTKLDITYRFFHTGYLFSPLKTVGVYGVNGDYTCEGGKRILPSKKGYNTNYIANFVQINVDHPKFYEFVEKMYVKDMLTAKLSEKQDRELWRQVQNDYRYQADERYSLEDLQAYQKEIYQTYGQECEVSKDVAAYLDKIKEKAEIQASDKSIESDSVPVIWMLKAIENELRQMTYTLNPGGIPEEVDSGAEFLDYFLLESRQGYCSYYATAFVLLARAEGIPARYVEGFCVPMNGEAGVTVYSNMAHAWPEVYLEGVGWIPFEPTPGYEDIRYTPWEVQRDGSGQKIGNGNWATDGIVGEEELSLQLQDIAERNSETDEELPKDDSLIRMILPALAVPALLCIFIVVIDRRLRRHRYEKWEVEEKLWWELHKNMKMLTFLGYDRKDNESLSELKNKAWAVVEDDMYFMDIYEDIFYGGHTATVEMLATTKKEGTLLMKQLYKWKRLGYWYFKIIY